ncbi:MAG: xylulokinase [Clostridia bacterium]|nr:xylulokinase [Clostridia bacterium]
MNYKELLIGIDIGTSSVKVALFDKTGKTLSSFTEDYPVYYPKKGYAEHSPDEWYDAVCKCTKKLSEQFDLSKVAGVGIDGQGWSCIPVSKDGTVLSNTPIWFDTRATKEIETIKATVAEEKLFELCGNPLSPSYVTPKILWFKNNKPDVYEQADAFLSSNGFVVYRLTGKYSCDYSQAYGQFFYDIANCVYDEAIAEKLGIDMAKIPPLCSSKEIIGYITKKASKETGLKEGTPIAAGGLDAACGTLGAGVIKDGQTQEQGGQAGGMSICISKPLKDPALILGNHVVDGKWLLQGGTAAGGGSLKWFASLFGKSYAEKDVFKAIDMEAAKSPAGANNVIFHPYLNGERSPIWDPDAKGLFWGMSLATTRGDMARAVMEGVAYSLKDNLETAEKAGANVGTLYSVGGSASSKVWMQIKSDVTGKKMKSASPESASALGAAILAGIGTGVYSDFEEAARITAIDGNEYSPDKNNEKIYRNGFKKYKDLYRRLK